MTAANSDYPIKRWTQYLDFTNKNFKTSTLLWIAALLQVVWGLVPSASLRVIQEIPVELYIAIRWTISGFIFLSYLIFQKKWRRFSFLDLAKVAGLGTLGYALGSLGTLYGIKLGGVTNFALMGAFNPVITSLVAFLVLKERPQKIFYLALIFSVCGLLLLVRGHSEISTSKLAFLSVILIMGAAVLEALTFTFSKRLKTQFGLVEYLAIAQISAAGLMWLLQFTVFHQTYQIQELSLVGMASAIFVSVVACVFCYAILYWLLNHVDGHKLALFDGIHTLSATFFGLILFHESINQTMWIGGVLLILGLLLGSILPSRNKNRV